MNESLPVLPSDGETIAQLRELYLAAEARAARLRLLSTSGRELAQVDPRTADHVLSRCAERLAFFVGCKSGHVGAHSDPAGIPIFAPGQQGEIVGSLVIDGLPDLDSIPSDEDRDAAQILLDLMGTTIDRIGKERERADLLEKLRDRERSLEKLLDRIFSAQEEERRRVSHELHDGVAQTATALVRILDNATTGSTPDHGAPEGMKPADVARGLVAELRRVIAGLRPTLLDDLGLLPALQSLGEGLETDGYCVAWHLAGTDARLSPLIETTVFRVAQEAVANIRKHAGGPCAVRIEAQLDGPAPMLRITDSGRGPSAATLATGVPGGNNVGIEVMKERMAAIGGRLEWRAGDDNGVTVEARFPAQA